MTAKLDSSPDGTRQKLRGAGWILLALSLALCIAGPRLTAGDLPSDIRNRMGDLDWVGMGWIVGGMIVGALALMCFVAQWVMRPQRANPAHPHDSPQSKSPDELSPSGGPR